MGKRRYHMSASLFGVVILYAQLSSVAFATSLMRTNGQNIITLHY